MSKTSRTVHVRMKDRTLYLLCRLLQKNGVMVSGKPISSIVSMSCDALVQLEDWIGEELPDEDGYTTALNELLGVVGPDLGSVNRARIADAIAAVSAETGADLPEEDYDAVLTSAFDAAVNRLTNPDITIEGGLSEGEEISGDVVERELDLSQTDMFDWAFIKSRSPKDRLVELVDSGQAPDKLYQYAVRIVYHQLPSEDWGTEDCVALVNRVHRDLTTSKIIGVDIS